MRSKTFKLFAGGLTLALAATACGSGDVTVDDGSDPDDAGEAAT
jgi:hypothetical protein